MASPRHRLCLGRSTTESRGTYCPDKARGNYHAWLANETNTALSVSPAWSSGGAAPPSFTSRIDRHECRSFRCWVGEGRFDHVSFDRPPVPVFRPRRRCHRRVREAGRCQRPATARLSPAGAGTGVTTTQPSHHAAYPTPQLPACEVTIAPRRRALRQFNILAVLSSREPGISSQLVALGTSEPSALRKETSWNFSASPALSQYRRACHLQYYRSFNRKHEHK